VPLNVYRLGEAGNVHAAPQPRSECFNNTHAICSPRFRDGAPLARILRKMRVPIFPPQMRDKNGRFHVLRSG
jgi:hypothetical protein